MGLTIVISTEGAEIFQNTLEGLKKEKIKFTGPTHPVETNKNHPIEQTDEEKLYHKVARELEKNDQREWLILSQGPASDHFINHIERHHPQLKSRIVGSQKIGTMSEGQLMELSARFYRHLHLFQSLDS